MKSRLLMLTLAVLLVGAAPAFAQDPGIVDTISLVLSVDTIGLTATMELWVFSDEVLSAGTMGFTWDKSPTDHFLLDTVVATAPIIAGFDLGRFFYEDDSKVLTNTNQRFMFGAASLFSPGYPGDATGRRLWATYTFNITTWGGYNTDGIIIDTMTFNAGSTYLLVDYNTNNEILPHFTGMAYFGDPAVLDAEEGEPELPKTYALTQNYPNPFNPSTEIAFDLPTASQVRLTVYNILGQEVTTLVNGQRSAGHYVEQWDAGGQASGIYFYKLEAGSFSETRKMMLLK